MMEERLISALLDDMTVAEALKWQILGYELECENGKVTGIHKREQR